MTQEQHSNVLDRLDDLPAAFRMIRAARNLSLRAAAEEIGVDYNVCFRLEGGALPRVQACKSIIDWIGR